MSDNNDPLPGSGLTPEQLNVKFPAMGNLRPMAPAASTQVQATLRAEAIIARIWPDDESAALFDPALCPAMATRAVQAEAELQEAIDEGRITWDSQDGDYDPGDAAEQGAVRIWKVGSASAHVVRDRWRDHPNRVGSPVDYFAGMLGRCSCAECRNLPCNVGVSKACGGPTRPMPVDRGTLILLFRCCAECATLAGSIAGTNFRISVLEAQAKLPPGARIDPGSPVPPTP